MKNIVIIGSGGFGREVQWLINDINNKDKEWNFIGFIDENEELRCSILNDSYVLGTFEDIKNLNDNDIYYVCAVGDPEVKKMLVEKAEKYNLKPATLIHPSAILSEYVEIGEGSIICAGSIITVNIEIGNHVIINIDSTIGHDVIIHDYSTILPSVNISGNTIIEEGVSVGTGSAIIQGKTIGKYSIIGAGAVVIKDIPSGATAVGSPAKVIKLKNFDDDKNLMKGCI